MLEDRTGPRDPLRLTKAQVTGRDPQASAPKMEEGRPVIRIQQERARENKGYKEPWLSWEAQLRWQECTPTLLPPIHGSCFLLEPPGGLHFTINETEQLCSDPIGVWKRIWQILKEPNHRMLPNSAFPLLGTHPGELRDS